MKFSWLARPGGARRALLFCLLGLCCGASAPLAALAQDQAAAQAKSTPAAIRQYRDAVALQNQGVYDLASDEWESFLKKFPEDPLAAKARHYLGVCKLQVKKYDEAAAAFLTVLKTWPNFELAEDTYLDLGLAQLNAGLRRQGRSV